MTIAEQVNVAVVGAGLGGLSAAIAISRAGHPVTIYEQAEKLGEIGAGIQIPPNSTRIFKQWGLLPKFKAVSFTPEDFIFRSYRDGRILNQFPISTNAEAKYGVSFISIHRADYHRILAEEAQRLGAKIRLASVVQSINFDKPSIKIKDGTEFSADVIVAADGLNSVCRGAIAGRPDPPHVSGYQAYRVTVKAEDMKKHPELLDLATKPAANYWIGPDAHCVCYLVKGGELYNMVLACPDTLPKDVNTAKAEVEEVLDFFSNWDPRFRKLLSIVQNVTKWRVMNLRELSSWSHPSGTCVLMGDACHATLPNLGQGAAMAVEDAAVLGLLFEKVKTKEHVKDILVIFERLRKSRTTRIIKENNEFVEIFHMREGPRQRERDRQLLEEKPFVGYPNRLLDPELQDWMYAYDAQAEVDRAWDIYLRGQFPGTDGILRESLNGVHLNGVH